jgi:transcriptional regulator with XRE-family HTH domain
LAKRARLLRHERGWTIEEAAERFDVQPAMVRRIETGTSNPSLAVLVSVARAFGLSVSQLVAEPSRR